MDYKAGLITAGLIGVSALTLGRKYLAGGVCNIKKDLTGQVVIVTGSNTGIGKETARVLASMSATVILACRDAQRSLPVVEELRKDTNNENIHFIKLDLTDLKSIKEFADEFKKRYQKLNILINNAGIMAIPDRRLTKDGFELQFGTNHLGHFYLTTLLIDALKKATSSRVINLSSMASDVGKMNWDDLMFEKGYNLSSAYSQSKLANILFTKELQRRYTNDGIISVAVHPGVVTTDLTRYVTEKWYFKLMFATIGTPVMHIFGKSPLQGAQTSLYCALEDSEKLVGGGYYADCKVKKENAIARKEENGKKLWEMSEKLIVGKISN